MDRFDNSFVEVIVPRIKLRRQDYWTTEWKLISRIRIIRIPAT